jgi:hypothetical protein
MAMYTCRIQCSVPLLGEEPRPKAEVGETADGKANVYHYFVMTGLRCCLRLRPFCGNYFYAHTFAHCTSVCVGTFDGNVYMSDSMFRAFAWGGAST